MSSDLKLLTRVLVDVRPAYHAEFLYSSGQRHRSNNDTPGALHSLDYLVDSLVHKPVVEALDLAETKVAFLEEIMLKLPDKPLVAASGVCGIGKSERIDILMSGNLYLIEDKEAPSSDDGILLAPRVGLFAYWQANTVLEILTEDKNVN